jgi:hypothetical protein
LAILILAAGGLISSIARIFAHSRAEKKLTQAIGTDSEVVKKLEGVKLSLESDSPSIESVTRARQIIADRTDITLTLSDKEKKDILRTLGQGSDRSKANYIIKLIDEAQSDSDKPSG